MKRIAVLLAMALLVAACSSETPEPATAATPDGDGNADAPSAAERPATPVAADLVCNIDQLFVDGASVPAPEVFRIATGETLSGAGWIIDAETGEVPTGVHLLLEPEDPGAPVILQPLVVDAVRPGVLDIVPAAGPDSKPGFGFAITRDRLPAGEYLLGISDANGALLCSLRRPVEAL